MHGPGDAIFLILNLFSTKINLEHGTFGITFIRHGLNIFENYFFGLKKTFLIRKLIQQGRMDTLHVGGSRSVYFN